jgi:phenylacetate-CoA ligase
MNRFRELVNFTRKNSPYYRELYKNMPDSCENISEYPIVDQVDFWKSNEHFGKGILTSEFTNGIVFKSGGTSGNPKFSYFTREEWNSFTSVSGRGFRHNGIKKGDRIANLFYAGELYASFIYVTDLINQSGVGISFPISGQTSIEKIVHFIKELNLNVIASLPTTIINILAYLREHPEIKLNIDLILYGGESFYIDQLDEIREILPKTKVNSILYASVDGGELGYFDASSCIKGEHRCFDESTIMEIIDEETNEVISEPNCPGKLLVTNLNRKLMPLIRYPVGDRAMWTEPKGVLNRKFKLLGRSEEGARIGPATLYVQDIISIFKHFNDKVKLLNFQLIITHHDKKDQATLKIVPKKMPKNADILGDKILQYLYSQRSMLKDLLKEKLIHPIILQWCSPSDIECNPRTGKTKHIQDKRLEG